MTDQYYSYSYASIPNGSYWSTADLQSWTGANNGTTGDTFGPPNTASFFPAYPQATGHITQSDSQHHAAYVESCFGQSFFNPQQTASSNFNYFPNNEWGWPSSPTHFEYAGYSGLPAAAQPNYMNGTESSGPHNLKTLEQGLNSLSLKEDYKSPTYSEQQADQTFPSHHSGSSAPSKPKSWASIAGQPAQSKPAKAKPVSNQNMDFGTWGNTPKAAENSFVNGAVNFAGVSGVGTRSWQGRGRGRGTSQPTTLSSSQQSPLTVDSKPPQEIHPVLEQLQNANQFNPPNFDTNIKEAKFFIIKSYSEDDIHRSIKYGIWCSTEHGNKKLDSAYKTAANRYPIYLFFSVNASGHFCGVAEMRSAVDYHTKMGVWQQDKWKGCFDVKWLFVKDVPNTQLRHIKLENNENKPVTASRDTQDVPLDKGRTMLKIIVAFAHTTSIFDDFSHYEDRQQQIDLSN